MAWNDAPPTPQELGSAGGSDWTKEPPKPEELNAISPDWSKAPANALQEVKDAPANALGMAKTGSSLLNLTDPVELAKSLGQRAMGKPLEETSLGQGMETGKGILQGLGESAKNLGQAVQAPPAQNINDIQNAIIQKPLSSAINAASIVAPELGAMKASPAVEGLSQYAQRFGQNQATKALGATRGQIGNLGVDESRKLAQYALDKNLISPLTGPIGLEEKVGSQLKGAGEAIGKGRKLADVQGQAPSLPELLQQVKQQLIDKYTSGVHKGEMGGLNKAREELAKGGTGTFSGNAQKATDLNQFASKQNALMQPSTAATDVANVVSGTNNAAIEKVLTPAQLKAYQTALTDYSNLSKIDKMLLKGESREMAGRGGGSLAKTVYDKTADEFGNRTAAWTADKFAKALQNPVMAKYLPTLTRAAAKGEAAFFMTDAALKQQDPAYNALALGGQ